jgi:hypothetical protein
MYRLFYYLWDMASIQDKINACDFVINGMLDEQARIVYKNEEKITVLNKMQFIDGFGSDDKELFNRNPIFTGFYRSGELIGRRYDFFDTGRFINGMQARLFQRDKLDIFSTGTDTTADKYDFFTGYTNLFGLDTESMRILNYEIIYPELIKWIAKYL